ncbi:MAG: MarR family transcriptional regulator [Verrucomicrobiota bacterium]
MVKRGQREDLRGVHLWLVMMKAYRAVRAADMESIRGTRLGLSDFAVLELLLHKGATPVNVIGRTVDLTSGSITTAVDRLEGKKLVKRRRDVEDGRVFRVSLTAKGERLIERAFGEHAERLESVFSALTKGERAEFLRLNRKLGKSAMAASE